MSDEREFSFEIGTRRQGFATLGREAAVKAGKKGQQARIEKMVEEREAAARAARKAAQEAGRTAEEIEAAGRAAAREARVWNGGFKKGDPYTSSMAKFAINERWRKYYERKAKGLEKRIQFDRTEYKKNLDDANSEIETLIVPAKEEAKRMSQYLRRAGSEVDRVSGLVQRIRERSEMIRRSAAAAAPGQMFLPYDVRPGQIPIPFNFPAMPKMPGEEQAGPERAEPFAERTPEAVSEALGVKIQDIEDPSEMSRRVAQESKEYFESPEYRERVKQTGEMLVGPEKVTSETEPKPEAPPEAPPERRGRGRPAGRRLTEDEVAFISATPGWDELTRGQQDGRLRRYREKRDGGEAAAAEKKASRRRRGRTEEVPPASAAAPAAPAEEPPAVAAQKPEAEVPLTASERALIAPPPERRPAAKPATEKKVPTAVADIRARSAALQKEKQKKKDEGSLSEVSPVVDDKTIAAAAMMVAIVGGAMGNVFSLAHKLAARALDYREGRRDPRFIDPEIAASPAVQRALRRATRRHFF